MTLALSIRQPWAWAIINAGKDIENRSWSTKVRGRVLIHAGLAWDDGKAEGLLSILHWSERYRVAMPARVDAGGIVGEAEIVDCVDQSSSPWFFGRFGFVLRNARPLPFRLLKGRLGFFDVEE